MTDYMYHPGDRVRVRLDLSEDEDYKMAIILIFRNAKETSRSCH